MFEEIDPDALFEWADSTIREAFRGQWPMPVINPNMTGNEAWTVNVTLRGTNGLRASMSGNATTLEQAVKIATQRAIQDCRFGRPLVTCEVRGLSIELWILTGWEMFDPRYQQLDLGVDGIDVSFEGRYAYYKPSVSITSSFDTTRIMAEKVRVKAGIPANVAPADLEFRLTRWLHFLRTPGSDCIPMQALRPIEMPALSCGSVADAVKSAAGHLMDMQLPTGAFLYKLDLVTGDGSELDLKHVRTAGCTYALAWIAEHFHDTPIGQRAIDAVRQALNYLFTFLISDPTSGGLYVTYRNDREGALGASALLLRALQFEPFRQTYQAERESLCRTLRSMHLSDGSFRCYVMGNMESETSQDYYPGEALLALAVEAEIASGVISMRSTFGKSLEFYRTRFCASPRTSYVLWHADSWRRIGALAGQAGEISFARECDDFVMTLAEHMLEQQLKEGSGVPPRFVGGFSRYGGPTVASTAYAEGLMNAALMAYRSGQIEIAAPYLRSVEAALRFAFRLQVRACQTVFFNLPSALAIGAVTLDLVNFQWRADNDQHLITLGLRYLESGLATR
jgi:AMMECR1